MSTAGSHRTQVVVRLLRRLVHHHHQHQLHLHGCLLHGVFRILCLLLTSLLPYTADCVHADEEHLAACLHPYCDTLLSPTGPSTARTLQHCTTDSLLHLHPQHHNPWPQQQQQQHAGQPSPGRSYDGQLYSGTAEGRRRVTLGSGDPAAETGVRAGGGLLTPPGPAVLQHSRSERPNSRGGTAGTKRVVGGRSTLMGWQGLRKAAWGERP